MLKIIPFFAVALLGVSSFAELSKQPEAEKRSQRLDMKLQQGSYSPIAKNESSFDLKGLPSAAQYVTRNTSTQQGYSVSSFKGLSDSSFDVSAAKVKLSRAK